ncbi:MAG: SDR family oxidoreductase [Actinomycetota bacterium]|nr:SDR family oxidoreductase [Actinomycetota bacterium]
MQRRVAVINDAAHYVGPALAREFAARGHDLVLSRPADGLVDELVAAGAAVEVVDGVSGLRTQAEADALAEAALRRFGRIDAATAHTGQIVTGPFVQATDADLQKVIDGCVIAPYHFLRAVVPPMVQQGAGQVLLLTSATAARPTRNAPLYSSMRAGATMLARNVADEVAHHGVQVNVVGTNYIDFPGLLQAMGATTPEARERVERQVPMRRLGGLDELAAFCLAFLDGSSRFVTGQFVRFDGGWSS